MCTTYNLDLYFAYIVHIKQSFPTIFFFQIRQSQNVNIASFKGQLIQKFGHFSMFSVKNLRYLSCLVAAQQAKILKKSAIQGNHTHFTIKKARVMEPIALIFFIQPTVFWIFLQCHLFFQEIQYNCFLHNNVVKPKVKSLLIFYIHVKKFSKRNQEIFIALGLL